jgi:hypothetical protein
VDVRDCALRRSVEGEPNAAPIARMACVLRSGLFHYSRLKMRNGLPGEWLREWFRETSGRGPELRSFRNRGYSLVKKWFLCWLSGTIEFCFLEKISHRVIHTICYWKMTVTCWVFDCIWHLADKHDRYHSTTWFHNRYDANSPLVSSRLW